MHICVSETSLLNSTYLAYDYTYMRKLGQILHRRDVPQTALLSSTHTCMFKHVELVTDCSVV